MRSAPKYLAFRLHQQLKADTFHEFTVDWSDSWLTDNPADAFAVIKAEPGMVFVLWAQDRDYHRAFAEPGFDMVTYLKKQEPSFILVKSFEGGVLALDGSHADEIQGVETDG